MDMYKLKFTALQMEIFSLLCLRSGEKLSQREIALILKVSPTAITKAIKKLQESQLIKLEKMKTINFVSLNRDKEEAIQIKRAENLRNVYTSGLFNYLRNTLQGGTIILFGSYSRGEDTNTSDIDLAVIGRNDKILDLIKYEALLSRKIHVNFYKSWKVIHKNLKDNILNGILLSGCVELCDH